MKTCAMVFGIMTLFIFGAVAVVAVGEAVANNHATQTSHAHATATVHGTAHAVVPATALPTSSKPSMTTEQQTYIGQLYENVNTLQSTATQFAQLMQAAVDQPALMRDATWEGQMALILTAWQTMYNEATAVTTAPDGLGVINGKWIETLGHFNLAADHYAHGIDHLSAALIKQGTAELTIANTDLAELTPLIADFANQYN